MKTSYVLATLAQLLLLLPVFGTAPVSVCITEVFPDPTPSLGLPEKEFVEIYNASSDTIDLKGWSVSDRDKAFVFPVFSLAPGAYLILCKAADVNDFKPFGTVLGFSSFITQNNDGDDVFILSPSGNIVSHMSYTGTAYTGGRSLENPHLQTFCTETEGWSISTAQEGGTPGQKNSNNMDLQNLLPATITAVTAFSDTLVEIDFSFNFQPAILQFCAVTIDEEIHAKLSIDSSYSAKALAAVPSGLLPGRRYELNVLGLRGCVADSLPLISFEFINAQAGDSAALLISELLFNPYPGLSDFIEIYNTTAKYLDLKDYCFANKENGVISNKKKISGESLIIEPYSYLAFTPDKDQLIQKYPAHNADLVIALALPSWNDDSGTALLLRPDASISDIFTYNQNYQMPLLSDKEGVSLERVSFSIPASIADNWHSTAEMAGYATPGMVNSQNRNFLSTQGWTIDPPSFSPDGDGYKDFASIQYALPSAQIASIQVYDVEGRLIRKLVNNASLSSMGFVQWDGSCDDATLAHPGYYIVHIKSFDLQGTVYEEKKPVVLALKDR